MESFKMNTINDEKIAYLFNYLNGIYSYNAKNQSIVPICGMKNHNDVFGFYLKDIDSDYLAELKSNCFVELKYFRENETLIFLEDLGVIVEVTDSLIKMIKIVGHLYKGNADFSNSLPVTHLDFEVFKDKKISPSGGILIDAMIAHHLTLNLIQHYDGGNSFYCPSLNLACKSIDNEDDIIQLNITFESRID